MARSYVLFNTEIGRERDVLDFLRRNVSSYGITAAFPVYQTYDIVGIVRKGCDEAVEDGMDMKKRNGDIRSSLILSVEDGGFIKEENMSLTTKSFCLINTEIGKKNEVLRHLETLKGITEAHPVKGVYDIVAKTQVKNPRELKNLVIWKIRGEKQEVRSILDLRILKEGGFVVDDGNIKDYKL